MGTYNTPGIYIEKIPSSIGRSPITGDTELTGAFIGVAQRGLVGVPYLITSWSAYLETFALGLATPFIAESELAYAVYGFFQNGGARCYVIRAAHIGDTVVLNNAVKATATVAAGPVFTALDEGTWGNDLSVRIAKNVVTPTNFDLFIKYKNTVVEKYENLVNTTSDRNYWRTRIAGSRFFSATGNLVLTDTESEGVVTPVYTSLSGGQDGIGEASFVDADLVGTTGIIRNFDAIDDINLISIPGHTSDLINAGIINYCEERKYLYAILDCDISEVVSTALVTATTLNGPASFIFPWIKVSDPLSTTNALHECPPCGHVQGVFARVARHRGVWKSPAGTEAQIKGAIDVRSGLTSAQTDSINMSNVTPLMLKANYGTVVWGAKSVTGDYVSHVLLDQYIMKSIYNGTQPFVFEPNTNATWSLLSTQVESFLNTLWKNGGLVGKEAKDAYYVICDETINTEASIAEGYLYCEVGYKRPGVSEFIVFRFSHDIIK